MVLQEGRRGHGSRLNLGIQTLVTSAVNDSNVMYQRQSTIDGEDTRNGDTEPQALLWGGISRSVC